MTRRSSRTNPRGTTAIEAIIRDTEIVLDEKWSMRHSPLPGASGIDWAASQNDINSRNPPQSPIPLAGHERNPRDMRPLKTDGSDHVAEYPTRTHPTQRTLGKGHPLSSMRHKPSGKTRHRGVIEESGHFCGRRFLAWSTMAAEKP
jgi:hypothetical protein